MTEDGLRAELKEHGFAVVKGAIPEAQATKIRKSAFDWLKSFGTGLDLDRPETWIQKNLPINTFIKAYGNYCAAHEKFMWDARMEPGVLDAFSQIWGTDELLVSFGGLMIALPNRADAPARDPWEHVDQHPRRRGLHCVQGIINLGVSGPEDGGLVVYPGSHKLHDEFFDTHSDIKVPVRDVYVFDREEMEWFKKRGLRPHKVCSEPGDLIMWDSRTIHYGGDPTPRSTETRVAIYATYMPAAQATAEKLALKKTVFEQYGSTMHWPFDYMDSKRAYAKMPDGSIDPRERQQPLELPEMSERLLKLADAEAY